jgi:hypothetical protein
MCPPTAAMDNRILYRHKVTIDIRDVIPTEALYDDGSGGRTHRSAPTPAVARCTDAHLNTWCHCKKLSEGLRNKQKFVTIRPIRAIRDVFCSSRIIQKILSSSEALKYKARNVIEFDYETMAVLGWIDH